MLVGCGATPTVQTHASPADGVTFSAYPVVGNLESPDTIDITLVVHNTTDQWMDWPGIHPEAFVQHPENPQNLESMGPNLKVIARPMEGQVLARREMVWVCGSQEQRLKRQLTPGEVQVYQLRLRPQASMQARASGLDVPDTAEGSVMAWPVIKDPDATGYWQLDLVFKPDGFGQGSSILRTESVWRGRQINLRPVVVQLGPQTELLRKAPKLLPPIQTSQTP